jgi:hypothetical protein
MPPERTRKAASRISCVSMIEDPGLVLHRRQQASMA